MNKNIHKHLFWNIYKYSKISFENVLYVNIQCLNCWYHNSNVGCCFGKRINIDTKSISSSGRTLFSLNATRCRTAPLQKRAYMMNIRRNLVRTAQRQFQIWLLGFLVLFCIKVRGCIYESLNERLIYFQKHHYQRWCLF